MPIDRLAPRRRPAGFPVLHQRWSDLAFLHWPVDAGALRRVVPGGLEVDTYQGQAWVGLTPFTVSRLRPSLLPPLPLLSRADEVNLRVYVHRDGIPGIWFPSLEITNRLALWGARLGYRLPYFHARMTVRRSASGAVSFASVRSGRPEALLDVQWQPGEALPPLQPDSLEFFLVERYVLYVDVSGQARLRARIHHRPWTLRAAALGPCRTGLPKAAGIDVGAGPPPLVHAQTDPLDVAIWLPGRV